MQLGHKSKHTLNYSQEQNGIFVILEGGSVPFSFLNVPSMGCGMY